ncbi:hypothetical protein pb186bvf_007695 [Paramecium bursaria]
MASTFKLRMFLNSINPIYPGNNCGQNYNQLVYCLQNTNNQTQFIYSKFKTLTELIIITLDQQQLKDIETYFQNELNFLIDQTIKQNLYFLSIFLVVSFIIQYVLIYFLNKPLLQLQQIANYQINSNLQKIYNLVRINKQQSQIQMLCNAYYNLININQKLNRRIPREFKTTIYDQFSKYGLIYNRYYKEQPIFKLHKLQ